MLDTGISAQVCEDTKATIPETTMSKVKKGWEAAVDEANENAVDENGVLRELCKTALKLESTELRPCRPVDCASCKLIHPISSPGLSTEAFFAVRLCTLI